jgi:uroporphyrinogen decarboxylase
MDMVGWVGDTIAARQKRPLPILCFPGARIIGALTGDVVSDAKLQADCILAVARRFDMAGALMPMDLSVEAEAFGAEVRFLDDEVPTVTGMLIKTGFDAEKLAVPQIGAGRTGIFLKAAQIARAQINDRPLFAGIIGPFSLAARLCGMTEIMYLAIDEPETVHTILQKATEFLINYISAFKYAGADGVIMAEPAAGILSPALNREFSSGYVADIVRRVQSDDFILIYHNCGNTLALLDDIIKTKAAGFHFGNAVVMADILPHIPPGALALGNIDPAGVFLQGSADDVRRSTVALLEQAKAYSNFVLSSGCDIPTQTPLENIEAFFEAAVQ